MRYEVKELEPDIKIRVSDAAGTSRLLQSMQECQWGQCGCPTDQYDKLDAIEVEAREDEVTVRLRPLSGERLDRRDQGMPGSRDDAGPGVAGGAAQRT